MKKIFCFGDGFATGHIWPEWPQILQALLMPEYHVIVTAGVGAGAEFLVCGFVDQISDIKNSTVIFQWPVGNRFDKLLEDSSWKEIITNDKVYHFNTNVDKQGRTWWLSSKSSTEEIKRYHECYVQPSQHNLRLKVYKQLIHHSAANLNCKLINTSTLEQDIFSKQERFKEIRQKEVQPSPLLHFYWLVEQIIPQTTITIDTRLKDRLETALIQTTWAPYDPDREEIWNNIKKSIRF
jgi:hypothetical protein